MKFSRLDRRIWLAINGQITVALRDPIGELDGQIALQIAWRDASGSHLQRPLHWKGILESGRTAG